MASKMADPADPPFMRIGPEAPASPVVLAVPHAGRAYSEGLLKSSRLPREKLETLEDRFVDRLIWRALGLGSIALVASVPRAEIDLNRDEREIDPSMVAPPPPMRSLVQSPRTRGGLGLVPSRISGAGSIWLSRLPAAELARRVREVHAPYHAALEAVLEETRARFGVAILLDCHSMPPREDGAGPQVIFGDRHGTSASPLFLDAAIRAAEAAGYEVRLNAPYAGGYTTARHGRPESGIHAIQLELDRSIYLNSELRSPGQGFDRTAQLIADIAGALAARALEPSSALAAE